MRRLLPSVSVAIFVSIAAGCADWVLEPYGDNGAGIRQPGSGNREVVAGDTLYSIAWESGRDYQEIAAWNNISPPYMIKPGQRLRLNPPDGETRGDDGGPAARDDYYIVASGDTLYRVARKAGVSPRQLASWNNISPPFLIQPGQRLRLTPTEGKRGTRAASRASGSPAAPRNADVQRKARAQALASRFGPWAWPIRGRVLENFSHTDGNKGIDIGGKRGEEVVAAATGTVVYQGSGLRGYGQLIIIKHDADFLSAYAHCDKIYVKEGHVIKRGQKIAEMGSSGTDRVKLHFEIRYRGVPVDPLEHLPKN